MHLTSRLLLLTGLALLPLALCSAGKLELKRTGRPRLKSLPTSGCALVKLGLRTAGTAFDATLAALPSSSSCAASVQNP